MPVHIIQELLNLLQVFVRGFVLPSYPDAANALELAILHQLDLIDTQMRLNACNLHLLPEHIILRIFSHLGFEDLCCVSQVSKACLNASMNGPLWRNLYDYYDLMLKGELDTRFNLSPFRKRTRWHQHLGGSRECHIQRFRQDHNQSCLIKQISGVPHTTIFPSWLHRCQDIFAYLLHLHHCTPAGTI